MKFIRPLSEVVLWGMEFLHRFIPNYGWIIIIFSVLTKLLFYPLTKTSTESMKKMQELQPKLKALQEKYKNDKEKLNKATMELYQEEKVNPLSGCLPLLVQSPVFFALYQALSHTISLRGQPLVLWMKDLSQPDALFQMPFSLPFLGADFNVLPILMSVAMYFQTKLTPTSGGGQMAMMNTMMPLIMIFIFYNMPSGLVLYWLVNTLLQGYQTWKIHKTAPTPEERESMTDKIEIQGKTVDAAVSEALLQLGARRDEVEIKVLEEPKTGFMGILGGRAAKVLVRRKRSAPAAVDPARTIASETRTIRPTTSAAARAAADAGARDAEAPADPGTRARPVAIPERRPERRP